MSSKMDSNIKRFSTILLSSAVAMTSLVLPQAALTVYADTPASAAPTTATYQDGSEANPYTEYSKVYFGYQNLETHRWYIAGKENETNSLVILCDPATDYGTSQYLTDTTGYSADSYNSSELDNAIQDLVSRRYFSDAQQALMKEISINCPVDNAHPTSYYETLNRKMYAANAYYISDTEYKDGSILVGSGDGTIEMTVVDDESDYVANVGQFWLRSPYFTDLDDNKAAMMSCISASSGDGSIKPANMSTEASLVPVTQLDLSYILFASSATPAVSGSTFDSNAMTIRCYSDSDRISAEVTVNTNGITVTKGSDSDEYLYVQWNDGTQDKVFSIQIDSNMAIAASCIGVSDLTNCRIWVEKKDTDDDLIYAKQFTEISGTGSYSHIDNGSGACKICGTVTHTHDWQYSTEDNKLEVYCKNAGCPSGTNESNKIALTLSADPASSGSAAAIHIGTDAERNTWQADSLTIPETVSYENAAGNALSEAPMKAGTYTAKVSPAGETPTIENTAKLVFTISKLEPTANAPIANELTYTGSEQALVTEGTTTDGTLQYSLSKDGPFADAVPKAVNGGSYEVYYKVVGDSEHNNKVFDTPVSVTIAKAEYLGTKEISDTILAGVSSSGSIQLPVIPEDMVYGSPQTAASELTDLSIEKGKLTYKGSSAIREGAEYTVTIPVSGGNNYEGYEITVKFTGKTSTRVIEKDSASTKSKTAQRSGKSAATGDSNRPTLWIILLLAAAAATVNRISTLKSH